MCEEKCRAIFNEIDVDKSGSVDFEEIKAYMEKNGKQCCDKVKELFQKHDKDGNGSLDFEEYFAMFKEVQQGGQCTACDCKK